jgi:hypothetical protein
MSSAESPSRSKNMAGIAMAYVLDAASGSGDRVEDDLR